MRTAAERVRRFIARREFVAPGTHVVWSDPGGAACVIRLDDLRELLAAATTPDDVEVQ